MMNSSRSILLVAAAIALSGPFAAKPVDRFTFVHITDMHITAAGKFGKNLGAIIGEINAMTPRPAFVLATGDLTELGFREEYAKYRETVSTLTVPLYNVMGNHETKWSNWGKAGIKRFLEQKPYYSFDHGGVHFVGLDSSMWLEHNGNLDPSQLAWLRRDLDSCPASRPVVLFYHHCPGFLPNEAAFHRVLRGHHVPLALVGHGHQFRAWKRDGTCFQMTKAAMDSGGGAYRILEVTRAGIRSYRKEVGKERVDDGMVSFAPSRNPIRLLEPKPGHWLKGSVRIRAAVTSGAIALDRLEWKIGTTTGTLQSGSGGVWEGICEWTGMPGWHEVGVQATDSTGMMWTDFVPVRIGADDREKWRVRVAGGVQRPIRAHGDRLYFGACGGDVYCLDARTGRQIWRHRERDDIVGEVAVDEDNAYVGTTGGWIVALDARTGRRQWSVPTREHAPVQGSPAVSGGRVFIGGGDSVFYAIDAVGGKILWQYDTTRMTQATPVCVADAVLFGCWDQHFHALDQASGTAAWKTKIGELIYFSPANSNPATDGERIIVAGTPWHAGDPDIFCLNADNGGILWKLRNPGAKSHCAFNTAQVFDDRFAIVTLGGDVFCMKMSDGSQVWRAATGQEAYDNSPVYADDRIYVGGLGGGLFCFDAATGEKRWSYSTGSPYLFASPTVWKNLVIAASTDGTVTAVKADTGASLPSPVSSRP